MVFKGSFENPQNGQDDLEPVLAAIAVVGGDPTGDVRLHKRNSRGGTGT